MEGDDAHKEANNYRKKPVFRRPNRRCTYIIVVTAVVFLILVIVLSVQLSGKSKDDCPEGIHCNWHSMPPSEFLKDKRCDSVCTTEACLKSAHYALSRIDATKDPCDDFYEFACGTYEKDPSREDNEMAFTYQEMENEVLLSLKGIIDSVERTPTEKRVSLLVAKKVYEDCLHVDVNSDVIMKMGWKKMFAVDGPFPWLLINDGDDEETLQNHVVKMMSSTMFYEGNPFFEDSAVVQETVNPGSKSRWNIHITNPNIEELISIHKEADANEDENNRFNRSLVVMEIILVDAGVDDELKDYISDISKFEKSFVKEAADAINFRNKLYEKNPHLRNEHHTYTCQDLDHQMKYIKWCAIAKQILANYGLQSNSNIGITINAPMDYVKAVDKVLSETDERVIINYLALKFIMKHLKYMQTPLRDIYYDDPKLFVREKNILAHPTRWQHCVDVVSEFLWIPLEKEYLKEKLDEEKRTKVLHMVKKLKEAHISLLDKITWMHAILPGAEMKEMVRKLEVAVGNSVSSISETSKVMDRFIQEKSVPTLLSEERTTLIEDVLELKRLRRISMVSSNEKPDSIFDGPKFGVFKSRFLPPSMGITIRELAFPLFLPGRPMYMEYAAFGSRVSKSIVHLLSQKLVSQSTRDKAMKAYVDTANCLDEQHYLLKTGKSTYKVDIHEIDRNVQELINAIGTLGSFEAYKKYVDENGKEKGLPGLPFTNQQLFFISNAQIQCEKFPEDGYEAFQWQLILPARFRVNVPFANSKDFAQAFRCPVGSSMNPKHKCCVLGNGKSSENCQ